MKPKTYSTSEIARMRKLAAQGITSKVAALKLRRPHAGLRYKAHMLGISFGRS